MQGWLLTGVWGCGEYTVPYTAIKLSLHDKGSSLCLYCLYDETDAEHLVFFWASGILLQWDGPYDQPPRKPLDTEFLISFPDRNHFICVVNYNLLLEQLSTSCVSPPGEDSWTRAPGFLQPSSVRLSLC